jgi:coenzyme F420-0:L-glutamate ligase / coenzyme F420-1:gamma-L-glutamate ligase
MSLEFFPVADIPDAYPGMPLGDVIHNCLDKSGIQLLPTDVLAVAQKIVSKVEGRTVTLATVEPSANAISLALQMRKDPRLIEVILRESRRIVRAGSKVLISETEHGFICANAGVDRSNVDGGETVTLLPTNPDASARRLAAQLHCAVIITDTFGRAWREGLVDVAIGIAGMRPFIDSRGEEDKYGYPLQATFLAAADALAGAAGLVMGKRSSTPVIVIRGFEVQPGKASITEMLRRAEGDLFL